MKFHDNYIGNDLSGSISHESGGDSGDRVSPSLDWYYNNVIIEYSYNKFGHRCKNLEDIDLSNYVLFTGCSHTEGVGLELEKTFSYVTSDILQCDYYNLALGATGIDVLLFNLITWFTTVSELPRAVVIQWPDISRFSTIAPGSDNIVPNGTWSSDIQINDYIVADHDCGASETRAVLTKKIIELVIKCPIFYVTLKSQRLPDNTSGIQFLKVDLARDLAHFGIKSNEILAAELANSIKTI